MMIFKANANNNKNFQIKVNKIKVLNKIQIVNK